MNVSGYSTAELDEFRAVLDAAMAEAAEKDMDVPLGLMARRLFDAGSKGVRDPERLRAIILGRAHVPVEGFRSGSPSASR
jgi:hypothetical protein